MFQFRGDIGFFLPSVEYLELDTLYEDTALNAIDRLFQLQVSDMDHHVPP